MRVPALLSILVAAAMLGATGYAYANETNPDPATLGIARAERAGIKIDPAVREIMANAPLGSCLNDPTQSDCDTPTAIVADGRAFSDGSTGYADMAAPTAVLAQPAESAGVPQCFVHATNLSKSTGSARAYGQNTCSSAVQEQELYVQLREFQLRDHKWHQMDTGSARKAGGGSINAHADFRCQSSAIRAWENLASGYSDLNGVWYGGQNKQDENLPCVG